MLRDEILESAILDIAQKIVEIMKEKGLECCIKETTKNGVLYHGIVVVKETGLAPCLYVESLIDAYDTIEEAKEHIDDFCDNIIQKNDEIKNNPEFESDIMKLIEDKDWVLNNVYICLQRENKNEEDTIIKRSCKEDGFDGIEKYLFIEIPSKQMKCTAKLTRHLLDSIKITDDEVWKYAERNTFIEGRTDIGSILDILGDMTNFTDMQIPINMYYISNNRKNYGSGQILDKNSIKKWVFSLGKKIEKIICIPSSIHEWILIPITKNDCYDINKLNEICQSINDTLVPLKEQLGSYCYVIDDIY